MLAAQLPSSRRDDVALLLVRLEGEPPVGAGGAAEGPQAVPAWFEA